MQQLQARDYQQRIVKKVLEHFHNGVKSVGIVSPTGAGKTIMAMMVVQELERRYGFTTNWVAMRRVLLNQAARANHNFFNIQKINYVSMFDKNPPEADILVADELQHCATDSFVNIDSKHPPKFLLGMSATPFRTDQLKLPFQKMVTDAGIHRLIQEGWLSKYWHHSIENYDPLSVAEVFTTHRERWGKSIIFFRTMEECEECCKLINERGVKAAVICGKHSNAIREEIIESFEEGDIDVLINIMVLAEGFDYDRLKTVFVRDSGKLPTIQMGGRAFRIHPEKSHCNIVQSQNTRYPFTRVARPEKSFVFRGGNWFVLGNSNKVITVSKEMANKLANIDVSMPSYILKRSCKRKAV